MKAFRNTGIEGGFSLKAQNWLLAQHRSQQRHGKITGDSPGRWRISSKSDGPPVKTLPKFKGITLKHIAILLQYADAPFKPAKFGPSKKTNVLCIAGLIQCVDAPDRTSSAGESFGDTYLITKAGREYVEMLRSRPT